MDPQTSLDTLNDPNELGANRIESARALGEWLARKGFSPTGSLQIHSILFLSELKLGKLAFGLNMALLYGEVLPLRKLGVGVS